MLVYDDRTIARNGTDAWHDVRSVVTSLVGVPTSYDDLITALIAFGVFESAVADALCATRDDANPLLSRLRGICEALGTAAAAASVGDRKDVEPWSLDAALNCETLHSVTWPNVVALRVPEGYAYYGLFPESYAHAVAEWAERTKPARVLCLGLRSIGTSLSAIAAGALRLRGFHARSWTLRPRGDPFDRRIDLAPELVAALEPAACWILIVDEGPGLSGSSMTATAAAMSAVGVADDRIIFVPSWRPSADRFVSRSATARWVRHAAVVPSFDAVYRTLTAEGILRNDAIDISAGQWRASFHVPQPWPAVQPQHERRKYLMRGNTRSIARFAGLGTYGHVALQRAQELSDHRWTAPPVTLRRGFLDSVAVTGRPMRITDISDGFLRHATRYIAWLRTHASHQNVARIEPLAEMLRTNVRETCGDEFLAAVETLCQDAAAFAEPATAVDARLMPYEWLSFDNGWMKTDALDHYRDHFFPGCCDSAWDVAGLLVEFDIDDRSALTVIEEYAKETADTQIAKRLPFYRAAYTAFRAAYCAMAGSTLSGTDDGNRFVHQYGKYREALMATLASARPIAPSGP
jgi:hypothetical protein